MFHSTLVFNLDLDRQNRSETEKCNIIQIYWSTVCLCWIQPGSTSTSYWAWIMNGLDVWKDPSVRVWIVLYINGSANWHSYATRWMSQCAAVDARVWDFFVKIDLIVRIVSIVQIRLITRKVSIIQIRLITRKVSIIQIGLREFSFIQVEPVVGEVAVISSEPVVCIHTAQIGRVIRVLQVTKTDVIHCEVSVIQTDFFNKQSNHRYHNHFQDPEAPCTCYLMGEDRGKTGVSRTDFAIRELNMNLEFRAIARVKSREGSMWLGVSLWREGDSVSFYRDFI